jgi:hypothetical protein
MNDSRVRAGGGEFFTGSVRTLGMFLPATGLALSGYGRLSTGRSILTLEKG